MRCRIVGLQFHRLAIMSQRLVQAAQAGPSGSNVIVARGVGPDSQGLLVVRNRFLKLAAAGQQVAQVVLRRRQVGIDRYRLPILRQGCGKLALVSQKVPRLLCPTA